MSNVSPCGDLCKLHQMEDIRPRVERIRLDRHKDLD